MEACCLGRRSREIFEILTRELDCGEYTVGATLPPERKLAERFGVSRPTIRRAVAMLEQKGRIRTRHGSGMAVCGPDLAPGRSATISVMGILGGELLRHIQTWLLRRSFLPCAFSVTDRGFDPEVERLFLEQVRREKHHGLVAFCSPLPPVNTSLLDALASDGTRIIHIAPFRLAHPDQEYLLPDFDAAGRMAGERLRDAGCQAGIFVRMHESPYEMQLERGFRKRIPGAEVFLCPPNLLSHLPAREQATAFLAGLPANSGIFCRSSDIAAALATLHAQTTPEKPIRLIAVADESDSQTSIDSAAQFDRLVFPTQKQRIDRALDILVRPGTAMVNALLPPIYVPAASHGGFIR